MILRRKDIRKRRIASVGMMDGVHAGHRFLLEFLKAQGRQLGLSPAVVTFEAHPLSVVHPERVPKLLTTPSRKLEMLDDGAVDDVIVLAFDRRMSRMSARKFLEMLHDRWGVDALVVGFNNRFGRDRSEGIEAYRAIGSEIGIKVMEAPEMAAPGGGPLSSSAVRAALERGNVEEAAVMLIRQYELWGRVEHGQALGRTLGYPTANISPEDSSVLVPAGGVYASWVTLPDGSRHAAMLNIGTRPTVPGSTGRPAIEAHLLDFDGDIYGSTVKVEFAARLRDEKKFRNLDALTGQLRKDEKRVRKLLLR